MKKSRIQKFELYERAVQSPEVHTEWFVKMYRDLRGGYARSLREDFCGTFQLSAHWVARNHRNTALGIDLDPAPLAYGKRHHHRHLTQDQKARLKLLRQNVMTVTRPAHDLIVACNFSFFVFLDRTSLVRYFKCCRASLGPKGIVILEMAGGPGMLERMQEKKTVADGRGKPFTYVWDQKSFDPISRFADYSIHFKPRGDKEIRDAFTYHWRLWTIPEIREALLDAGFRGSRVYWEKSWRGEGTGEYDWAEKGDNAHSWVAYVVGLR